MIIISNLIDLTGQKFNKLLVIAKAPSRMQPNGNRKTQWLCQCDCGNKTIVNSYDLRKGDTKSCGCAKSNFIKIKKKKYNQYDLSGEYGIGYTSKREEFYFDLEDYDKIKDYCWYKNNEYILTTVNNKTLWLHKIVLAQNDNRYYIDHINHCKFDNRKCNLRIVTSSQNHFNSTLNSKNKSGYKGVVFDKARNQWRAYININYKQIYLGRYNSEDDAIKSRKEAEEKYFGEYSYDNSIQQSKKYKIERE